MQAEKSWIRESIEISADKEIIWKTLTGRETYEDWSSAWMPGSHFEGDWSAGSKMRFLGPTDQGSNGMLAKVVTHVPGESLTMEHIGVISDGVETFEGEEFDTWIPALEEYWLEPSGHGYLLRIVSQSPTEYFESFSQSWRNALARIKALSETAA